MTGIDLLQPHWQKVDTLIRKHGDTVEKAAWELCRRDIIYGVIYGAGREIDEDPFPPKHGW